MSTLTGAHVKRREEAGARMGEARTRWQVRRGMEETNKKWGQGEEKETGDGSLASTGIVERRKGRQREIGIGCASSIVIGCASSSQ